MQYLTY